MSVLLFVCLFAAQSSLLVLSPMLADVAATFGVPTASVGQLRSVSGAVAGAVALAAGAVAGRVGVRDLLLTGLGLLGLGSAFSAWAPTFTLLLIAQVPIGAGLALVLGGGLAAAGLWAPPGQRSRVLSWALIGQPAAWIVGMPLAGALTEINWRWAWLAVPCAVSIVAFALASTRPRDPVVTAPDHPWRRAFQQPGVRWWAVGELLAYAAWTGTVVYVGALFIESYGVSAGAVGLLLAGGAVAYLPGNFLARRWVDTRGRAILWSFALASSVLVALLGAFRPNVVVSFAVFAVLAFLAGGRTIAGSAYGLDAAPAEKVVVMSVRAAALQFGYLSGAALGGFALLLGGYAALGAGFAVLFALAALPHLRTEVPVD